MIKQPMDRGRQFLDRFKTEYDFKTYVTASGSLLVTVLFAFYNGFLGVCHASVWYGTICAYYMILSLLRGTIIAAAKRISLMEEQGDARNRVYLRVSILLLLLNISLVIPVAMMVRQQKPVNLTLIPAIAMAVYTTYKVTMASINLRKKNKSSDSLVWLLRTISFMDALVSVLTLQNTLIMVQSGGESLEMLPLTAASSAAVWVAVLLLSIAAILKGTRRINRGL